MIVGIVYDGPQYADFETFWEAILDAVHVINGNKRAYPSSYPRRLIAVIKAQGGQKKY
jgi:hypothetical protein